MRLQTNLLSLFLLALVLAPYVDASTKKNKNKKAPILSDSSTGRGDAVTLPSLPVLKSKPKPEPAFLLLGTTNTAPAVQLKDQGILVQSIPKERQVAGRDGQTKRFEELIKKRRYNEIAKLGNGMNDEELLKCLCQVVTSLDHFRGLYEYMEDRNLVPDFLANGKMVVVKGVIVETDLLSTGYCGECDSLYDAIALSPKNDRHDRVASLFEAAYERPAWKDWFNRFVNGFFERYPPEKDSMSLKRFLTLYGEDLTNGIPRLSRLFAKVWCGSRHGSLTIQPRRSY